MTSQKVDRVSPVLIGGLVGGVASAIPFLNCLNACCCLLYVLGGGIAGALYARQAAGLKVFPSIGDGAIVGTLAGVVSGLVSGLLGAILNMAFGFGADPEEFQRQLDQAGGDIPQEMREVMERIFEIMSGGGSIVIRLVVSMVLGVLFGLIGGMIGLAIFRKQAAAETDAGSAG